MEPTIARLHQRALQHARQATRLWRRSKQVLVSIDRADFGRVLGSAMELNAKAIDECGKALNTIDFLRRYEHPKALGQRRRTNGEHRSVQ